MKLIKVSRGVSLNRFYLLKLFGFAAFLHCIHHSDSVCLYHSHPWTGFSLIFGSYVEMERGKLARRRRFFNWIPASRFHRVVVEKPVWTLFFHLRRSNRWAVINESGNIVSEEPWRGDEGFKDYRN
jgi:hypothetical protein